MMFEVTTLIIIMAKNTDLASQPIICQLLSFLSCEIAGSCVAKHASDYSYTD